MNSPRIEALRRGLRGSDIRPVYGGHDFDAALGYPLGMPIYEYESVEDGAVIELLRSMKDADAPVEDPEGRGRTFRRRLSVFGVSGSSEALAPSGGGHVHSAGCGCGKPMGSCGLG
jgi:hypothetical protein